MKRKGIRKPNFFIIGAAKCGTTSLTRYLADHPRIFFHQRPHPEPTFFASDLERSLSGWAGWDENRYLFLFRRATSDHVAVGERSTFYIYSHVAVRKILEFNPEAKFILMLRSPVEMAYSAHSEGLYGLSEDEPDFERAWRLQDDRRAGRRIPAGCLEPKGVIYGDLCRLGEQVERLYRTVQREQVLVKTLDDLHENPRALYEAVLAFLGVPSDGRVKFPIYNENKALRIPAINRVIARLGRAKKALGIRDPVYIAHWVRLLNTIEFKRPPLRREFRLELCDYFRDDVKKLSELLGKDLSFWVSDFDKRRHRY
jgi:Sulfotransferase family